MNNVHNDQMPIYGEYDVIVSGGGLIGVVCATKFARSGKKVALVERRSALGWEVGRAWRLLSKAAAERHPGSAYAHSIANAVHQQTSQGEIFNAVMAELLFDQWVLEEEIDVMFHGWTSTVMESAGEVEGLIVGTREGYQRLFSPLVVETDDAGRLIDQEFTRRDMPHQQVSRSFFIRNTSLNETSEIRLSNHSSCVVRPISADQCRVDVELTEADMRGRDLEFHRLVKEALPAIKEQVEGCSQAQAFYLAEEEWKQPAFYLEASRADGLAAGEVPIIKSRKNGLIVAGAWLLPNYTYETEDEMLMNRILLGEAVASISDFTRESAI